MYGFVFGKVAVWAGWGRGFVRINAVLIGQGFGAVTLPELGKDGTVGTGELNGDFWRRSVEDRVGSRTEMDCWTAWR